MLLLIITQNKMYTTKQYFKKHSSNAGIDIMVRMLQRRIVEGGGGGQGGQMSSNGKINVLMELHI